ncbi:uncharacterized protein LOC131244459 isoform X1 [Magnolia sinica]|uniref:uncharacterized protein LOC131244459 isoform X1 n=1 Tax=Magnolia sinica TaxID=86752 RepID=UPI002658E0E9|nr:uncharacterized protein LOC131244459 isoform X1 [Magnolia sinica]
MANDGKMKLKAMLLTHSSSEIHSRKLQNFGDAFSHLASEQVCLAWSRTSSPRVKSASSMSKNQVHKRPSHCGALHLLDGPSLNCLFILKSSIVDFSFYSQVCKSDK